MPATTDAHPEKDQLVAFGLGKLDPAEASQIEQHLEACQDCCSTILNLQDDTFVGLVRVCQPASAAPDQSGVTLAVPAGSGAAHPAAAELPAALKAHDRYEIQELIGRGGMGDVYRAQHKLMSRQVALKVIKPQLVRNEAAVQRFRREVQAAASLHHKHIVTAYDAEQAGELHFLVMEFVAGVNLDEVIRQRGPLPVAEACNYIRQAAEGLQHAHELGMVHRDIKPHNLMVTKSGEVKILDFGLAGFATEVAEEEIRADNTQSGVETAAALHQLTQLGTMMGTPDYIAPEQAANAHKADIRADIYSLGCTFYTLLAGAAPFNAGTVLDKIKAHTEQAPRALSELRSDVSPEVEAVVQRMMAKDPLDRYQTPQDVIDALTKLIDARIDDRLRRHGIGEPPIPPKPRTVGDSDDRFNNIAKLVGLTLLAVAIVAGIIAGTWEAIHLATDTGRLEIRNDALEINGARIVLLKNGEEYASFDVEPGTRRQTIRAGEYEVALDGAPPEVELDVRSTKKGQPHDFGAPTHPQHKVYAVYRGGGMSIEVLRRQAIAMPLEGNVALESILDWTPLFNGRDLTGWKMQPDKPGNWRVENGVLIGGKLDGGSEEENSFLVTEKSDFTNFHLKLETKLNPGAADAGVLFDFADGSWAEANIAFDPNKRDQYAGSIIVAGTKPNGKAWQAAPTDLASPDQWFTLEVIAVGRQITTKVNGKIAATHTQRKKTTGPIRLQDHGPFTVAEFRKIEITELDEQGKPLHQDPSVAKEFAGTPAAGKVRDHLASLVAVASDGMQDDELQSWIKAQTPSLVSVKPPLAKMALEWLARLTDAERQQLLRDGYLKWKSDQLDPSRLKTLESMIQLHLYGRSGMDTASSDPLIATNAKAVARQLDKLEVGFAVIPVPRSQESFISWYVAPRETGFVSMNFPLVGLTPEVVMQPGGIGGSQTTRALWSIQRKPFNSSLAPLTIGMNDEFGALFEGRLVAPAELSRLLREALKENPDRVVAIDLPQRPWTVAPHVDQFEQIARTAGARHITRPAWAENAVPAAVPAESKPASKVFQSLGDLQEIVRTRVEQYGGKMDGKPTSGPNRLQYDARVGGVDVKLIDLLYADLKSKAEAANATVSQEEKRDVQLRVFRYLTPSQRGEVAVTLTEIPPEDGLNWRLEIEVFEWPKGALTPNEVFVHYLRKGGGVTIRLDGETVSRDDLLKRLTEMARRNAGLQVLFDGDVVPIGADVRELMQAVTTTGIPERNVKFAPSATRRLMDEALQKGLTIRANEITPLESLDQIQELHRLQGHTGSIERLAFIDNTRFVSAGLTGEEFVWDARQGKRVQTLTEPDRLLTAVAAAPAAGLFATGNSYGQIRLWNKDLTTTGTIKGPETICVTLAMSADGSLLMSSGMTPQVPHIWNTRTQELVRTLDSKSGLIMAAAFTPDGKRLVTGGMAKHLSVWDVATGELLSTIELGMEVRRLSLSPDGRLAAVASSDPVVIVDLQTKEVTHRLNGHTLRVQSVAFLPDGRHVVSGSQDKTWRVWSLAESREVAQVAGTTPHTHTLAVSPDGKLVAGGGGEPYDQTAKSFPKDGDYDLRVWELPESLWPIAGATADRIVVEISVDGQFRLEGRALSPLELSNRLKGMLQEDPEREVHVIPAERFRGASFQALLGIIVRNAGAKNVTWPEGLAEAIILLRELPGSKEWITDVAYPENDRAITVAVDGVVRVWKNFGAELESHQLPFGGQADISPDGRLVVVASAANDKDLAIVALWELDGWKERWKIEVPTTTTTFTPKYLVDVRFAPNDRVIVRSNVDSGVAIVDAANGKVLSRFPEKGPATGVASISPDGKRLFVRQMVPAPFGRIYRLEDGAELAQIDTRDVVLDAIWSRDGAQLILAESTLNEGRIAVFEASTGKLVRRWVAEPKGIESLALGQGNLLATGGLTRIAVWDWSSAKLLAAVDSPKQDGDARLAIALSPDGKRLISGGARWLDGEDRLPRIWQLPQSVWPVLPLRD